MSEFEQYLNDSMEKLLLKFTPGMKVKGTVCTIDKRSVFLDINSTSEGVIGREELLDKDGNLTVSIGDEIEAFYIRQDDNGIQLSVKITGKYAHSHLEEAYRNGIPIEGRVQAEQKGGYTVKIAGKNAFCPFSQMSLNRGEPADFIGNTYSFIISEMKRDNLIVSRRTILEKERQEKVEEFKKNLQVGDIREGRVVTVKDFGVFVDLDGVQGFIPVSELSWARTASPGDVVRVGDQVKVAVVDLDWERERITLSFRSANRPWSEVVDEYGPGTHCSGRITRLETFGAFVEIEPGVEGLIHISKLGAGRRIRHPEEVVQVGEKVEVEVESIDEEKHRIALARNILDSALPDEQEESDTAERLDDDVEISEGLVLKGIVDAIKPYGFFVKLTPNRSGLLHVSEADIPENSMNSFKALEQKHPLGSEISVQVKEIKGDKISLTSYEKVKRQARESKLKGDLRDRKSSGFGSLGSVFDDLEI